jgi:hypothetical protein
VNAALTDNALCALETILLSSLDSLCASSFEKIFAIECVRLIGLLPSVW